MKIRIIVFIVVIMLAGVGAAFARGSSSSLEFVPGLTIALPQDAKVDVKLLAPPLSEEAFDKIPAGAPMFTVGPQDNIWFGLKPATLMDVKQGQRFQLEEPLSDIGYTQGGALLLVSKDSLGFLSSAQDAEGQARIFFQPFSGLPLEDPRISVGDGEQLYVFGVNKKTEQYEVYLIESGKDGSWGQAGEGIHALRKVFASTEKIAAVSGDGATTFMAIGRQVLRLARGSDGPSLFFAHSKENVLELAGSLETGLFYATATEIGVVSDQGPLGFIRAPNTAIRLMNDSLYILLKNSFAVVRVGNAATLQVLPEITTSKK